jgi:hypothetical protein
MRIQPDVARERAVFHAVVQGEAHQINVLDPALLYVISKTCMPSVAIVEKRTVAINFWINPLVENMSDSARVECAGKLCAVRVLNAMHRPQDLLDAIQYDPIAVFFAWVICRKTAVIGWMPVLRGKNQLEASLQLMAFGMSGTVRAGADNAAQVLTYSSSTAGTLAGVLRNRNPSLNASISTEMVRWSVHSPRSALMASLSIPVIR